MEQCDEMKPIKVERVCSCPINTFSFPTKDLFLDNINWGESGHKSRKRVVFPPIMFDAIVDLRKVLSCQTYRGCAASLGNLAKRSMKNETRRKEKKKTARMPSFFENRRILSPEPFQWQLMIWSPNSKGYISILVGMFNSGGLEMPKKVTRPEILLRLLLQHGGLKAALPVKYLVQIAYLKRTIYTYCGMTRLVQRSETTPDLDRWKEMHFTFRLRSSAPPPLALSM